MAQQGWYPDPGGQPGMFRYWDGQEWSSALSPTALPGPPPQVGSSSSPWGASPSSSGYDPTKPITPGQSASATGPDSAYGNYHTIAEARPKKPVALWIFSVVGVVVLALVVYFAATTITGGGGIFTPPEYTGGPPQTRVCPKEEPENVRADHPEGDGWVYGGALAYKTLSSPWSGLGTYDTRVPFGRDVADQTVTIHNNPNPFGSWGSWVASVLVGELYAGDGFYDPEEGSQIVNKCIFGAFYGDESAVKSETLRSEPYSVSGYDGWITETMLSFKLKNLPTTSELAIVIIVRTSDLSSSIYYASLPTDAMELKPDIDASIASLKVVI